MIPILFCLFLNRCTTLHPNLPSIAYSKHWQQTYKKGRRNYKDFWRYFHDSNIDRMVAFALAKNPDLKKAKLRILEARSIYNGALINVVLPQNSANLQLAQGQNPLNFRQQSDNADTTQQQFELSWELDVLGKKAKTTQARSASLRMTELEYDATFRLLIVDVVTAYIDIQLHKQLLKIN